MTNLLALLVALATPIKPDAACETTWAKAESPTAAETERCLKHFLAYGYGANWKAEDLTLDPTYGDDVERRLSKADLERMAGHVKATCSDPANPELPCARAIEFFNGMAARKTSVFEDENVGSYEAPLTRILKGEGVDPRMLFVGEPGMKWSAQTLRKLRNAAYARHGYVFKDADLNEFFYGPRTEPVAGLPLPQGDKKTVELTTVDNANVQLIKSLEK